MSYISINKLVDGLNKEIKNLAIYFDKSYEDFYDKNKINVSPLLVGLNLTDGTKETLSFKQLRDLFPQIKYIKVPINIFMNCNGRTEVKKVIVDGRKITYKDFYYFKCKLENLKSFDEKKLEELIRERDNALLNDASDSSDASDEFI